MQRYPDEQSLADREADDREERRAARRYWIITLLVCWAWCLAGGALVVWGFHVVDPVNGPLAVNTGAAIATAGPLLTIAIAGYHRSRGGYG